MKTSPKNCGAFSGAGQPRKTGLPRMVRRRRWLPSPRPWPGVNRPRRHSSHKSTNRQASRPWRKKSLPWMRWKPSLLYGRRRPRTRPFVLRSRRHRQRHRTRRPAPKPRTFQRKHPHGLFLLRRSRFRDPDLGKCSPVHGRRSLQIWLQRRVLLKRSGRPRANDYRPLPAQRRRRPSRRRRALPLPVPI